MSSGYYFSRWLDPSSGYSVYHTAYNDQIIFIGHDDGRVFTNSKKLISEFPDLFEYRANEYFSEEDIEKISIQETFFVRDKTSNLVFFVSTKKESILRAIKEYRIKNL